MRRGLGRCDRILLRPQSIGRGLQSGVVDRTRQCAPIDKDQSWRRPYHISLAKVAWSQELEPDAKTKATLLKIPGQEFGEMALRPARELVQLQA